MVARCQFQPSERPDSGPDLLGSGSEVTQPRDGRVQTQELEALSCRDPGLRHDLTLPIWVLHYLLPRPT